MQWVRCTFLVSNQLPLFAFVLPLQHVCFRCNSWIFCVAFVLLHSLISAHLSTAPLAPCSTERIVICNKSQPKQKKLKKHFVITQNCRNYSKRMFKQSMKCKCSIVSPMEKNTHIEVTNLLIVKLFLTPELMRWQACRSLSPMKPKTLPSARNSLIF